MPTLNGERVEVINSRLRPKPERPDPIKLEANSSLSFNGSFVRGMGFTLTPEERDELVARDSRNAERIFPYIGGREVNSSPTQSHERYVINFGAMPLHEAEQWPDLIDRVRRLVKPDRDKVRREAHKKYWWHYGDKRPALYRAIAPLEKCLVTACVSKHVIMSFQPTTRVFSHKLYVFPLQTFAAFATLQSRVHEPWAWLLSSTMKTDLNYSASKCFETFPLPDDSHFQENTTLDEAGRALYEARAAFMVETQQGLTTTYNLLKNSECEDPAIERLRKLHEDMDRAVLAAYAWSDIEVPPLVTPTTPEAEAARQAFEDEVIDRLYTLNYERAGRRHIQGLMF